MIRTSSLRAENNEWDELRRMDSWANAQLFIHEKQHEQKFTKVHSTTAVEKCLPLLTEKEVPKVLSEFG
uniref:Uncharacterized protein n=1 Tax=Romanomermis culicivorax TaxID=13658 RepID=A0A915IY25_ROMCU